MAKKKKKATNREIKIEKKIEELRKEIKEVIKEKSILDSQRVGKKIDDIIDNEFINELRGNSKIGVFEEIRSLKKNIKAIWVVIVLIVIFSLGGNYRGITGEKIKEKLGIKINNIEERKEKRENIVIVGKEKLKDIKKD